MELDLKEEYRDVIGWDGKNTLSVREHGGGAGVLCFQIRPEVRWFGSPKSGKKDVIWLTHDQVKLLAKSLTKFAKENPAPVTWTDSYGTTRTAEEMTTEHLWNVLGYLRIHGKERVPFYFAARNELRTRGEL